MKENMKEFLGIAIPIIVITLIVVFIFPAIVGDWYPIKSLFGLN